MKRNKKIKIIIASVFAIYFLSSNSAWAQSQVGNPTNAYWDGVNLPMAQVEPGVWAIYSGDITDSNNGPQDGTVDGSDIAAIANDANLFAFGYNLTDLTGDGASDGSDLGIAGNNSNLFLFTAKP